MVSHDDHIAEIELFPVSVPYKHREVSSQVNRDGVSDVIVKITSENGVIGWGESCSGADILSIVETLNAMKPFVVGRSPWESELIRQQLWWDGLWQFRKGTAGFAYAGLDMAMWDICGKLADLPLFKLFGGKVRDNVNYFYYLSQGSNEDLARQCEDGIKQGFHVFYLKVGLDFDLEVEMIRTIREVIGPKGKIRLDANGSWTVVEAIKNFKALETFDIDFVEAPVMPDPLSGMKELRSLGLITVCANEGLWTTQDAYRHITERTSDVINFSPYWVGSLAQFQRLAFNAHFEGIQVCKHTHGELGIAAAASHHILLTLPNIVDGNQHTAYLMADDILEEPLPIAFRPDWGVPNKSGLGVAVDEAKVIKYAQSYQKDGQFLPYDMNCLKQDR